MAAFGYWNVQGLGQHIRMVLHYTDAKVEDTVYAFQEGEKWQEAKSTNKLGLPFPNLPYYVDGDTKLTQSDAILRHLGRKHGLYGNDSNQASQVDMLVDTAKDLKLAMAIPSVLMKNLNDPKKKKEICSSQDPKFKGLNEILGKNQFLAGNDITIADFAMYDAFKWYNEWDSTLVSKYPNIMWYLHRFENVPKIKSFLGSSSYMKNFFIPIAVFGGNRAPQSFTYQNTTFH